MSEATYTIKIKKEYASAIIEDLKQVDAIEIIEEPVAEWQKEESLKRLSGNERKSFICLIQRRIFQSYR